MRELALHILDIVQNSLRAEARCIKILIEEDQTRDRLQIEIADDGCGMTEKEITKALDPFYTTRTTRKVGLGLSLFQANCQAADGDLTIESQPGRGTVVRAQLGLNHIDTPPLGDLPATMVTLIAGSPEVEFFLTRKAGEKEYRLATQELREVLGSVPLNQPQVIGWLREYLQEQEKTLLQ